MLSNSKFVFIVLFALCVAHTIFAANSNPVDVVATINSSLELSISATGAQSFDPSVRNDQVKIGQLVLSARVSHGFQLGVYRSLSGGQGPDYANSSPLTLTSLSGDFTNTYNMTLRPQLLAPTTTPQTASNYGGVWNVTGPQLLTNVVYDLRISTSAKNYPSGTVLGFRDNILFTLAAL